MILNVFCTILSGQFLFLAGSAAAYFSGATLHANCLKIQPTLNLTSEWGLRLFGGAQFYIPFGNRKALEHISGLLLPRNKGIKNDMDTFCGIVDIRGFKLRMDGHGDHYLIQDCSLVKKGVNHCTVNSQSEDVKAQQKGDGIFTIVWTDNKANMVVVRCTSDGLHNDWYVFSKAPSLNTTMKSSIVSRMVGFGFPHTIDDTISPSYQGCEPIETEEED